MKKTAIILATMVSVFGNTAANAEGVLPLQNIKGTCDVPHQPESLDGFGKRLSGVKLMNKDDNGVMTVDNMPGSIDGGYFDFRYSENSPNRSKYFKLNDEFKIANGDVVVVDYNIGMCYLTPANPDNTDEERQEFFDKAPKYLMREPLVS